MTMNNANNAQMRKMIEALEAQIRRNTEDDLLRAIVADNRVPPSAQPPMPKVTVHGAMEVKQSYAGNGTGWSQPQSVDEWKPPHQRGIDALMDAEDAQWRAARKKELGQ
jgi:hypothetical protein